VLGPVDDVLAADPALPPQHGRNLGHGPLAPVRVGHGHHAGLEDVGVLDEHGFEGDRGYVFAAWGGWMLAGGSTCVGGRGMAYRK
jgi:hypothetical protein